MNDDSNKPTITWVTRTGCVLAILFAVSICVLSYFEKGIPPELNTLAGITIGGVFTMLTKSTPSVSLPPIQDVNVTNPTSDPANIKEVEGK